MDIYQILHLAQNVPHETLQRKYEKTVAAYRITAAFAEDEAVREIAVKKLDQLLLAGREAGLDEQPEFQTPQNQPQYSLRQIKLALNSARGSQRDLRALGGEIDALEESAEKHYLKSVWFLRTDTGANGLNNLNFAVLEIQRALTIEPDNEAYGLMLEALTEAVESYQARQEAIRRQEEQARQEALRREEEARKKARRAQNLNTAGDCFCGCCGGAFEVCCSCCGGCCESC